MKEFEKTCEKFYVIHMMMHILEESEDNEEKKRWVKKVRDKGYITNEEALDLYTRIKERRRNMNKGDWIPCSERLPETPKHYYDRSLYLTCTKTGYITSIYWWDGWNCLMNEDGTIYREHEIKDIIAWMPLPEPYKEG